VIIRNWQIPFIAMTFVFATGGARADGPGDPADKKKRQK